MLSSDYINQLAINSNTNLLLVVMWNKCGLQNKIKQALKNSHVPFCSEEDYVALYALVLQDCVKKYNPDNGDFLNFFSAQLDYKFKDERKSSFLKVSGNVDKSKRIPFKSTQIEKYEIGKNVDNYINEVEVDEMNQKLKEIINAMPNGNLLIYKYFSSSKTLSNEKVGKHFGLTEKQVRTRLKNAFNSFATSYPSFFEDYYYGTDATEESVVLKIA